MAILNGGLSLTKVMLTCSATLIAYIISDIVYNLFFHPLAKFPGPRLRAAFYFPAQIDELKGRTPQTWHQLHEEYGDFVRVNPNSLSIIGPGAWKDIYAYGNKKPLQKHPDFYEMPEKPGDPVSILGADDVDHPRIRKPLSYAFSDQALREQEPLINEYITCLVQKLHSHEKQSKAIDIMRWLNFTTFDITGDLTFDESFGALETGDYNSWIANMFALLRTATIIRLLSEWSILRVVIRFLLKVVPAAARAKYNHENYTAEKTERRLNKQTDRKDFLSYVLKYNKNGEGITHDELLKTSGVFIIAGSETSATLLSGAVYYLLTNREWLEKLYAELRANFNDESQISFTSLAHLKTLNAIINETFRIYPPLPTQLPRLTPRGGVTVNGTFIPQGTTIGIAQYGHHRSSRLFKDPHTYAPERFLGDEHYTGDALHEVQPFSVGPRNCIGKSLAWAELRMILARLVWHFDFELQEESKNWAEQKVYLLWEKPALMVKLKARQY